MLEIITIISLLIALNFILLKFSCNKVVKKNTKQPVIIHPEIKHRKEEKTFAPTGS